MLNSHIRFKYNAFKYLAGMGVGGGGEYGFNGFEFRKPRSSVQKKYYCTLWLPSPGAVHCLLKSARKFHIFQSVTKIAFGFRMLDLISSIIVFIILTKKICLYGFDLCKSQYQQMKHQHESPHLLSPETQNRLHEMLN